MAAKVCQSMASYLSSWLFGTPTLTNTPPSNKVTPTVHEDTPEIEIVPPKDEEEDAESDDGYDTDRPPAFPALNSPQRAATTTTQRQNIVVLNGKGTTGKGLMGPPPPPSRMSQQSGTSLGVTTSLAPLATTKVVKKSRKVALAPGHSTLDWANLKSSGADLRVCIQSLIDWIRTYEFQGGVTTLLRVTPSMLKEHNKKDDAWTCIGGKVYNMTPYLPYHPGGEKELMRVAGRDGTKLFGASFNAQVVERHVIDVCSSIDARLGIGGDDDGHLHGRAHGSRMITC